MFFFLIIIYFFYLHYYYINIFHDHTNKTAWAGSNPTLPPLPLLLTTCFYSRPSLTFCDYRFACCWSVNFFLKLRISFNFKSLACLVATSFSVARE